jgi:hypothetical protein
VAPAPATQHEQQEASEQLAHTVDLSLGQLRSSAVWAAPSRLCPHLADTTRGPNASHTAAGINAASTNSGSIAGPVAVEWMLVQHSLSSVLTWPTRLVAQEPATQKQASEQPAYTATLSLNHLGSQGCLCSAVSNRFSLGRHDSRSQCQPHSSRHQSSQHSLLADMQQCLCCCCCCCSCC